MSFFENLLGSLFNYKKSSRNDQTNKSCIKTKENYGKIAGRDFIEAQPKPTWIKQREIIDEVLHHFKSFFYLASQIKDRKCCNSFHDCRNRMNREFIITRISVLDENHQKEIYEMHHTLISLSTIDEYTHDLRDAYLARLQSISGHYLLTQS